MGIKKRCVLLSVLLLLLSCESDKITESIQTSSKINTNQNIPLTEKIDNRKTTAAQESLNVVDENSIQGEQGEIQTEKFAQKQDVAYFAWGCFWCIEAVMDWRKWVYTAISGYAGWTEPNPSYESVSSWNSWYREAVKVIYDPTIVSYIELLELFFTQIDPLDSGGQFADRWFHYTTAVYYSNEEQKTQTEAFIKDIDDSKKFESNVVTKILPFTTFGEAEEKHQDYAKKQSSQYKRYKKWSWRQDYIEKSPLNKNISYQKPTMEELKQKLTPLQFKVTQEEWTEAPFDNKYNDNKQAWIYVDIVDGTPLFSSVDKYDSWSGWPSFTRPIDEALVQKKEDRKLFSVRTEVRSSRADSHLWHVFPDGPTDKWGLRYCINSAALDFIAVEELEEKWYWEYWVLFE